MEMTQAGAARVARPVRSRTSAEDVTARSVEFVFLDLFPVGFISVVAGHPSQGKSLLSYLIAAEESQSNAILFTSREETREHVWRPRLEAAGATLNRCHMQPDILFSTNPADAATLETLLIDTDAKVLIVDPIMNHTDRSIFHPTLLRKDLRAMEELIAEYQVAAIFLHHLVKSVSASKHPLAALSGSGSGLPAVARSVYLFSKSPEDEDVLVLANAEKHNLAEQPPSHTFQIETRRIQLLGPDDKTITEKDIPYLQYTGPTNVSARDLLPVMRGTTQPVSQVHAAKGFLIRALEDGPVPVRDLKKQALLASVAPRTMQRAADALAIDKQGDGGWALPPDLAKAAAQMKADKARLGGEHAETHLEPGEVAEVLRLVPKRRADA
jgi:putative DNA primase/helicase